MPPLIGTTGAVSARGFGLFSASQESKISVIATSNGHVWVRNGNSAFNSSSGMNYTNVGSSLFENNTWLFVSAVVNRTGLITVAGTLTRLTCCGSQGRLRLFTSSDQGVTWVSALDTGWGGYDAFGIVRFMYGNGNYLLFGTSTKQFYSADGVSWTQYTPNSSGDARSYAIINSRWLSGNANGGNNYKYNDSTVPTTAWTASPSTLNFPYDQNALTYGGAANGLAFGFGVGNDNRYAYVYSTNGSTWTGVSTPYGFDAKYLGWNNVTNSHWAIFNITPAQDGEARRYTTTNGTSWTLQNTVASNGGMSGATIYTGWGYLYFSDSATPLHVAPMFPYSTNSTAPSVYVGGSWQTMTLNPTLSSVGASASQINSISSTKYPYGFQAAL